MNSPPITLAMLAKAVGMVSQLMIFTEPASAVSQPRPTPASQESTANTATKIASEVSEAMEGHRKLLMDDKLPHRTMLEVELADAVIRVFDLAGGLGLDVGGAIYEKLEYNASRHDHKIANRREMNGKKF